MTIIAVTGGIGSGKTTVVNLFKNKGIDIIDTDVIARQLVLPGSEALQEIVTLFGQDIVDQNQQLNRSKLRELIFKDEKKRQQLEDILHPRIHQQVLNKLKNISSAYALLVIPLLVESNHSYPYERVLLIDVDEQTQIQRTVERDNCSEETIKQIISVQASREQRKKLADDIIDNTQSLIELNQQVESLHQKYLSLS